MPRSGLAGVFACALACAVVLPSSAAAQSNRPDPDSPAGVEYELPLDQTREDLSGGGGGRDSRDGGSSGGSGGSDSAPLFGAGISPAGGGSGAGSGSRDRGSDGGASSEKDGDGSGSGRNRDSGGSSSGSSGPVVSEASAGDSGSTGFLIPGIALAVVLAGGLLGLALRRGLGRPDAS